MGKKLAYFFLIAFLLIVAAGVYLLNPFQNKVKAGLQVITNNGKASLFLDDQYLDKTPYINKQIQPGEYTLRIEPDNPELASYETPISLNRGTLTVVTWNPGQTVETSGGVTYELEPVDSNKKSEVSFVSIPDNAIIAFDDRDNQFTPVLLKDLEPGHHEFEATLPSYQPQKHTINLVKGHRLKISVKLAKAKTEAPTEESKTKTEKQDRPSSDQSARQEKLNQTSTESGLISQPTVRIKPTNYYRQDKEVLRVRDQANPQGQEVGFVEAEQEYQYLDNSKNNWHQIKFKDALDGEQKQGWVSGEYAEVLKAN
jgi:hypothetical protein